MTHDQRRSHLPDGTHEHTFLVYDAKSGEIVHGHKTVIFPGQPLPEAHQLEHQALEVASQVTKRDVSSLRALAVDDQQLDHGTHYCVDTVKGVLQRVTKLKS